MTAIKYNFFRRFCPVEENFLEQYEVIARWSFFLGSNALDFADTKWNKRRIIRLAMRVYRR